MKARSRGERVPVWVFRLILRGYPREFREAYGKDLLQAVRDRMEAGSRGRSRRLGLLTKEIMALLRSIPGARASARQHRRGSGRDGSGNQGRRGPSLDHFKQDLAYAFRSFRRSPLFTGAALLTLGLGVGATTSMFSVVNGVLLKPLPIPDQDRVLAMATRWDDSPERFNPMSKPDLLDLADLPAIERLVGYTTRTEVLLRGGSASMVPSARVTSGILAVFGLRPYLGRDLRLEESSPGHPSVVVVSYGFWQNELSADPDVVGSTLKLNDEPYEVVGVAPDGFDFPEGARLWRPYVIDLAACGRGCHNFYAVGHLSSFGTVAMAREQAGDLAARLARAYPESNLNKGFHVLSLEERLLGDVRGELWVLLGAVALVLLIACANVANLLLARAGTRASEMGVRASLGASRARLACQMLTESLVLALLGGGLGLGLAFGSTALLRRFPPDGIPRISEVAVDANVVLFTSGLVVLVALAFGLSPALHLARSSPAQVLQTSRRGGGQSRPRHRFRHLLLGSEMALSVLLLVGAGLLVRTLDRIHRIDPGFHVNDVARFNLVLPSARYQELSQIAQFYQELEARIGDLPQVAAVGSAYGAPMSGGGSTGEVLVDGMPDPPPGEESWAALRVVTPGYFDAQGIPVLRGRGLETTDDAGNLPVALVNEAFVREHFPGQDPLGRGIRVTVDFGFGSPTWTIVGVVQNMRAVSLTQDSSPEVYVPLAQAGERGLTVVVHLRPGGVFPLAAVREIVGSMDQGVPLRDVETMRQVMASQTAATRFYLTLLAGFAVLAMVLASVGLYGVTAYLVSIQRQEIGIRLALGAERMGMIRLVLAQATAPVLLGLGGGLIAAALGAKVLERFLYQVDPRDPLVYGGVSLLLLVVAASSALIPARQASRVDPGEALREE